MKFSLFFAAFALLIAFPLNAQALENETTPVIKVVAFHSDSCGSCKILGPRIAEAKQIINQDKITMIKFDFTNKESIKKTKTLATEKGVDNILQKYGAKTGFVVLVNEKSEVVDMLKVDHNTADIAAKLATAIANAS